MIIGNEFSIGKKEFIRAYLNELMAFPRGRFDDQADSTSQALDWLKARQAEPGIFTWYRMEYRKELKRQGRVAELAKLDERYGVDG